MSTKPPESWPRAQQKDATLKVRGQAERTAALVTAGLKRRPVWLQADLLSYWAEAPYFEDHRQRDKCNTLCAAVLPPGSDASDLVRVCERTLHRAEAMDRESTSTLSDQYEQVRAAARRLQESLRRLSPVAAARLQSASYIPARYLPTLLPADVGLRSVELAWGAALAVEVGADLMATPQGVNDDRPDVGRDRPDSRIGRMLVTELLKHVKHRTGSWPAVGQRSPFVALTTWLGEQCGARAGARVAQAALADLQRPGTVVDAVPEPQQQAGD